MSAKDPIEDMFRDNQHGLDEQPRGLLWDKIEEGLDEKQAISRKLNWWKYAAAASVVAGMTIGVWAWMNNDNTMNSEMTNPQIVLEDTSEINEENASQILDKLEENKQSVVTRDEKKSAPEIIENEMEPMEAKIVVQEPTHETPNADFYETAPMMAPVAEKAAPSIVEKEKAIQEEIVVFRGNSPEKKEGNYIKRNESASSKIIREDDMRRMGNMSDSSVKYESAIQQNQISIPIKNTLVQYDLVSQTDSSVVFKNGNVNYPNQIMIKTSSDSIRVIYSGKENKKNSKESQNIQKYIKENKSQIASDFGLK